MADKKKIPINADSEVKAADAVSLTDRLNLAAERMASVSSEAQEKRAEQARLLKNAEAEAARRREEATAARLEAEKQAKTVADRKLMEYSYAENYRKKLLKDKQSTISAARAKDIQKKADAEARRRAELEEQIAALIESEKREAEERRARQDAALERARAAREILEENKSTDTPEVIENNIPSEDNTPIPADNHAPAEEKPAQSAPAEPAGPDDGMVLSIPSVKISPKMADTESEQTPAYSNEDYEEAMRQYNEGIAAYEQQMKEAQQSAEKMWKEQMAKTGAPAQSTAKTEKPKATAAKPQAPKQERVAEAEPVSEDKAPEGKVSEVAHAVVDGAAVAVPVVIDTVASDAHEPTVEDTPAEATATTEVAEEPAIQAQMPSDEAEEPVSTEDAPSAEVAENAQADKADNAPACEESVAFTEETAEKAVPVATEKAEPVATEKAEPAATEKAELAEEPKDTAPTDSESFNKYLSEIGTLSALVATHDERLRQIEEENARREREAEEERERLAREAAEREAAALEEEAKGLVDAEQIIVRENKQPVYDEEAIKRDIESMNRKALPVYLDKCDKKLRSLEKQARRAESRIDKATEDDRIEATLIAIAVRKEIVDLLCENLKCCVLFKVKKHNAYFSKKIRVATAKYNALVAIYESIFGEELTKANPAVVDGILDGDDYMPLPSVTYVKETVQVPKEDTELSSDGQTVKVARRITASEAKLRKRLAYHVEKKNAATLPSQRAAQLAECLMIERDIVELFCQGLSSSSAADNKKQIKVRKKKLDVAVAEYNAFADEFEDIAGGEITRAAATLSDEIIETGEYTPLPEIRYSLERIVPEKSAKEAKRERRAALLAARRGEIMPDDVKYLGAYITRSDKAALKLETLIRKNERAKRRLRGEAYNRAILNGAMLRARIVVLDRDCLIAAYRLDADKYITACKDKLLSAVQNYNADITEYDDATGIKLVKISPTLGEDIVSGRSFQAVPELLWRERFVEVADLSSLTAGDGRVFVFPTLDKVASAQSTDEDNFIVSARLGSLPLTTDRPVALPVNTAKVFGRLKVDRKGRLSAFDSRLKTAEHLIERELVATKRRAEGADKETAIRLAAKCVVLLREMVNRRIEGLTYAVSFSRKRRAESYKLRIIEAMVRYNAAIDEYNALADEKLSYADAHIPYAILAERDYSPLPEIVYRREFIEKNGDEIRVVSTLAKKEEPKEASEVKQEAPTPADTTDTTAAPAVVVAPTVPMERRVSEPVLISERVITEPTELALKEEQLKLDESLEAWNSAAMAQYNGELAENAANEAKNRADMADYMKRLAESYSVSARNNSESARYYRDLSNDSAIKSDNSVKMASYYARLAEEQRSKAEYIAEQAAAYERDAAASAQRVKEYAEKANETVDIASITMLEATDSLERKIGVGVVTSSPASYRAGISQILDDQGLRKYAEKNDRRERVKESRMRGLTKRAGNAEGNEKITLILDSLIEAKGRIDIIADTLRQAVRSDSARYKKLYRERLRAAIADYNSIAEAYTAVTLKPITPVDPSIVDAVLEGKRYAPIPDITYTRGFKTPGEESVVALKPGISVEEAVSTTTFTNRAVLAETISKQLSLDLDAASKGIEYEIRMLERCENVSQVYRFGTDGKRALKATKEKIKALKKDGLRATEAQRQDDERYYSVVYANPMTVSVKKGALKAKGGSGSRLDAEHNAKSLMAVREDIARIRENVIALLDERHKINGELVALYTGSDVDPHGLPVSDKYQQKRMRAARRSFKKQRGRAATVKRLSTASEATKAHIFDLMNKKIVQESNLKLFKYRYSFEKHTKAEKKLIINDIKQTQKNIKAIERDINGFLGRAIRVQRRRKDKSARGLSMFILFLILVGASVLVYIFRDPIVAFLRSLLDQSAGGGV